MARLESESLAAANRYIPLAVRTGRRWAAYACVPAGDVIGAAMLGLCRGAIRWRPDGLPLVPYLRIMIEGEIRRELRRSGRWRARFLHPDKLWASSEHEGFVAVDQRDEAEWLRSHLHLLTPRERRAVELYCSGLRWIEVAATMNIAPTSVERLRRQAVARLRRGLRAIPR